MYFVMLLAIISAVLCFVFAAKQGDGDILETFGVFSTVLVVIMLISISTVYTEDSNFIKKVASRQETINEIMGDKEDLASDRERAELVAIIMETNDDITRLKLDNAGWMWSLETPNNVDKIKPLEMVCTCPK